MLDLNAAPAATATRAVLLRHALTAGVAILIHGSWVDQTTADAAVTPVADYV